MHTLWLSAIFGLPAFFLFHWGLDTLRRNAEDTSARLVAAQHFSLGLMLLAVYAVQVLPLADAPAVALYGIGTFAVLLVAFGVHLFLRVLRVMGRLPPGVGLALAYVWTVPGLWTLATGQNLFSTLRFVRTGMWIDPVYDSRFHLTMWASLALIALIEVALGWVRRRAADPGRRGQITGLMWGAGLLSASNLFLGALLPAHTPAWLPPYPYLLGMLLWIYTMRLAMSQHAFRPHRLQQYHHLFALTPAPLLMVDSAGRIADRNSAAVRLLGPSGEFLSDLLSDAQAPLLAEFRSAFARRQPVRGREVPFRHAAGIRWLSLEGDYITVDGTPYCILVLHDLTQERERQAALTHMALHDDLTQLPNAAHFYERLAEALAPGPGRWSKFAVAIVDLDNFKRVNDTWGHQIGNAVLVELAERLTQHCRGADMVSRLGGDEFGVLLADVADGLAAQTAGDRLLAAVAAPILLAPGASMAPTISVGLCLYPSQRGDVDSLIRAADIAMYQAKRAGKNRAYVFREEWAHDGPLLAEAPQAPPAGLV